MHDRVISPIMSLFDGHHVRVSVIVKSSKKNASSFQENIGWRLRCDEVPYKFIQYPSQQQIQSCSGPLWIGPLMNKEIAERMSIDAAMGICHPSEQDIAIAVKKGLNWDKKDIEYAARETVRSVKHIAEAADLLSRKHLLLSLDSMPRLAGTKGAPKRISLGHKSFCKREKSRYSRAKYHPNIETMTEDDPTPIKKPKTPIFHPSTKAITNPAPTIDCEIVIPI